MEHELTRIAIEAAHPHHRERDAFVVVIACAHMAQIGTKWENDGLKSHGVFVDLTGGQILEVVDALLDAKDALDGAY